MNKKGVKRPMKGSTDGPDKKTNDQSPKKFKSNGQTPQKQQKPQTKPVQVAKPQITKVEKAIEIQQEKPVNIANGAKLEKINEKQQGKQKKQLTPEQLEKQQEMIKQKKQKIFAKKNEKRKQKRAEGGQYNPAQINLNAEEIDAKIAAIKSREQMSNTARRKLAVLEKKKKILEGNYVPAEPTAPSELSSTMKRKIRKSKMMSKIKAGNTETTSEDSIEKAKGGKIEKSKAGVKLQGKNKIAQSVKAEKKGNKSVQKVKGQKKVIHAAKIEEVTEDDDEEEEDSEDDKEGELDSTLNTTAGSSVNDDEEELDSTLNTTADASVNDDDDDDDDDDEDESEEEIDTTLNTSADVSMEQDDESSDEKEEAKTVIPKAEKKEKLKEKKQAMKKATNPPNKPQVQAQQDSEKKTRYVLFVGNLPYDTNSEDLKRHFLTKVTDVRSVRIPTKPDSSPKGIAFVEFNDSIDYEKGLSLHNTIFNGRQLSVQYSEGGSKKSGKRPNVVAKNQKLHALRKQGKLAGSVKDSQKRNFRRNKKQSA